MKQYSFILSSAIVAVLSCWCSVGLNAQWTQVSGGVIPPNAFKAGWQSGRKAWYYIARTQINNEVAIGETAETWTTPIIPYNGMIHSFAQPPSFSVYTGIGIWIAGSNARIPQGAIVVGNDKQGRPIHIARAAFGETMHIGSVKPGQSAQIPLGNRVQSVNEFAVLVYQAPAPTPTPPPPPPVTNDEPCGATRINVALRGTTNPTNLSISFQGATLSAPADPCGQNFFPNQRVDRWFTFVMPPSGRVILDFNLITTAVLYTGNCNALIASGGCRLDAGGNNGETFFDFRAAPNTTVTLRVFGNASSQRTFYLYEAQ